MITFVAILTAGARIMKYPYTPANVSLIAAAPELLTGCVEAENWLDNHGGDPRRDAGLRGLLQLLRDAIQKAAMTPEKSVPTLAPTELQIARDALTCHFSSSR